MLQKRQQAPKCGSNEEEKKILPLQVTENTWSQQGPVTPPSSTERKRIGTSHFPPEYDFSSLLFLQRGRKVS
jgi:hypothetical protein